MNAVLGNAAKTPNAVLPKNTAMGTEYVKPFIGIVAFIGIMVGLYYLYKFLYGRSGAFGEITILEGNKSMTAAGTSVTDQDQTLKAVAEASLSGVLDGGQYTASMWLYVASAKGFGSGSSVPLAHLLEISNKRFVPVGTTASKGKTLLFVGLNPQNGSLIVRQSSSDLSESIDNSLTEPNNSGAYPLSSLISTYTSGSASLTNDDRCDILNGIEYQRWVLVTVVGNGRTLDVYIDGKLARSCVYKGGFELGSSTGGASAYIGLNNNDNLKGYFANVKFANYAKSPDQIWSEYQGGPSGYFSLMNFFKNLISVDVSFSTSAGLNE